ncbi:PilZ domain-containing protein [Oryzifoliimicrobium ureilyticus]|uniref:PilZ domain-containing protein n=1 Tax=Oryzifoliimicrobium ureilyticus TaxID=3113724 RepID=UPI0030760333
MLVSTTSTVKGMKTRGARRSRCRLSAVLKYRNLSTRGRIVDISLDGMALDLEDGRIAGTGSKVVVECEEIGTIEGIVRWGYRGRVGVQYDRTSNASAKVAAYFRFHHQEVVPVLRR